MVAEFWPGWFDHWGEGHHKMEAKKVKERVSNILRAGASINLYMFHGKLDTNSLILFVIKSQLKITATVLILAVSRMRVTYELRPGSYVAFMPCRMQFKLKIMRQMISLSIV